MKLGSTGSTALTAASTAAKLVPGAQPFAMPLSIASFAAGMFKGHVSRPKFYADITISESGATATRAYGNSDASGENQAIAPGFAVAKAIYDLTKKFNGAIIKPFNLGIKTMSKYNSIGFTIGQPISRYNPEYTVIADNQPQVDAAVLYSFILAVKRGYIKLDNVVQQDFIDLAVSHSQYGVNNYQPFIKTEYNKLYAAPLQAQQVTVQTSYPQSQKPQTSLPGTAPALPQTYNEPGTPVSAQQSPAMKYVLIGGAGLVAALLLMRK